MASQLRKAIIERSTFKSKGKKIGEPANETAYQKQRKNLVIKLNKEAKKNFSPFRNQITENIRNKKISKLQKVSFAQKDFHYPQQFTLKTKRGIAPNDKTTTNIFNNFFVNITKSLDIPE